MQSYVTLQIPLQDTSQRSLSLFHLFSLPFPQQQYIHPLDVYRQANKSALQNRNNETRYCLPQHRVISSYALDMRGCTRDPPYLPCHQVRD
jgi:hypothetical protein